MLSTLSGGSLEFYFSLYKTTFPSLTFNIFLLRSMDNSPRLFPKLQTFCLQHLGQDKKKRKMNLAHYVCNYGLINQLWI